jgi:hypothetical protein
MILPYNLLPDVRWFILGQQQQQFPILQNAPFLKQNGSNRYTIAAANHLQSLTIPVHGEDRNLPLPQVRINYSENWLRTHKQAWQTAYGKSPFYEYYDYRFWALFDQQPPTMQTLIEGCHQLLFTNLKIPHTPQYLQEPGAEHSLIAQQTLAKFQEQSTKLSLTPYPQVFDAKFGFREPVSALDLLFNLGPTAQEYLQQYPTIKP